MTKYLFANNATSFLAIDTAASSATLSLMAGEGERFPQPSGDGSDAFVVTIEDRRNQTLEICLCTGRSTDILQVQRGQEGTTPLLFRRGSTVSARLTAAQLDYMRAIVDGAGDKFTQAEADGRFVNATGDVMNGPLSVLTPTDSTHAANKLYVDTTTAPKVHTHTIPEVTGLQESQAAQDAVVATKEPAIVAGGVDQFWRGDKSWQPIASITVDAYPRAEADLRFANVSGDTMTGPLVLAGDPLQPLQAATKAYVDANIGAPAWVDITGKPATFPPSAHTHTVPEIVGLQSELDGKAATVHTHTTAQVTGLDAALAGKEPTVSSPGGTTLFWRADKTWASPPGGGSGGGIPEAPGDGQAYSRRGSDASWVVASGSGGGIADATVANSLRSPGVWVPGQPFIAAGATDQFWRGDKTWASLPVPAWTDITGKPSTFPPTLPIAQSGVTNLTTDLAAKLPLAGGTMTGPITLQSDPSTSLQAATKQYVDNKVAAVSIPDGDKGDIVVSGSGSSWMFDSAVVTAAAKTVLDDPSTAAMLTTLGGMTQAAADAKYVDVAGDTMTGVLTLPLGTVSAPALAIGAANNGIYAPATDRVAVSAGGSLRMQFSATGATTSMAQINVLSDPTTAMGLAPKQYVDAVSTAFAAADALLVLKAGDTMTGPLTLPAGTAGAPALNVGQAQMGLWRVTNNNLGIAIGGINRFTFTNGDHTSNNQILLPGNPSNVLGAAPKQYVDAGDVAATAVANTKEPAIAAGSAGQYWDGTKTWVNLPSSGGVVSISDTPPASPVDGQQWFESDSGGMFLRYNDGTSSQWIQTNGAGIAEAPNDGAEYVRVSGVWRKKTQTLIADGLTQIDVDVPPTAKLLRMEASIWWASVSANNAMTWRASLDGSTFLAGGSDYFYGGFIHYSGSAGYANLVPTNEAFGRFTFPGDTPTQPVRVRWLFQVVKSTNTTALHAGTVNAGYYNTPATNGYTDVQMTTGVQSGTTLAIKKLRFFNAPTGVAFANGSFIVCEWMY